MIAPVQTARGSESWRSNADLAAKSMWIVDVFNTDLNPSPGMLCITCGSSIHPLWTSTPSKFIPPSFKFKQLGNGRCCGAPPPPHSLWPQGLNERTASFEALKKCLLAPSQVPLDICEGFSHSEDEMAIITDINPFCVEVAFKVIALITRSSWNHPAMESQEPEKPCRNRRQFIKLGQVLRASVVSLVATHQVQLDSIRRKVTSNNFSLSVDLWSRHCKAYIITLARSQGASPTEPQK